MATKLSQQFVEMCIEDVKTLAREIQRLECYCSALETKCTQEQINEASAEGAKAWNEMEEI